MHRDAAVQWEGWHMGGSTPVVSPPGESWAGQLGREGQRGSSQNKGMEGGEPRQFVNGWPSGETGTQGQGECGQEEREAGPDTRLGGSIRQGGLPTRHDTIRPLTLVVPRPGYMDSQRQANPGGQEVQAV